jgi:hypothetical protein
MEVEMRTKRLKLTKAEIQEHHASLLWLKSIGIPVSGADDLSHPPVRLKLLQVDHELGTIHDLPGAALAVVLHAKLLVFTGGIFITRYEATIPWDPLPLDLSDPEASAYYEDVISGSIPYPPMLLNRRLTGEVPLRRGQVQGMIIAMGWSSVPPQYHDHKQVPIELSLWDECDNELGFAFWARVDRSVKRKYEWLEQRHGVVRSTKRVPIFKPEDGKLGEENGILPEEAIKHLHAGGEHDATCGARTPATNRGDR